MWCRGVGMELRARGRGRRARWRAWCVLCGAACALWALWARGAGGVGHAALASRRAFPRLAPAALAHRLADFATLPHAPHAAPLPGSWRVEEEHGNYSVWRYRVRWACGARCSAAAEVSAQRLRVDVRVTTCLRDDARALPWSWSHATERCDEIDIEAEVEGDGAAGAVLSERARAACGAGGDAACAGGLRAHRADHHARLAAERSLAP